MSMKLYDLKANNVVVGNVVTTPSGQFEVIIGDSCETLTSLHAAYAYVGMLYYLGQEGKKEKVILEIQ